MVARAAVATPSRLALLAPQQNISWSFEELDSKARKLATGLEDLGYTQGSVALSDIPNVAENILLQLALGHLGAAIATPPKDEAALAKLASKHNVRGVVCLDSSAGVLSDGGGISEPLPMVEVGGDGTRPARGVVPFYELVEHCPPRGAAPLASEGSLLGSYGGAELTHGACLALGEAAASKLAITPDDRVCCSVTLMHAFGIGSATSSALVSGAAVVLPAVGGIKGCGNPAQRAEVTLDVLKSTQASVMFGDTHTLKAMAALGDCGEGLRLRTGVVKIASGSDFLDGITEAPPGPKGGDPLPLQYGGVAFHAMGKKQ